MNTSQRLKLSVSGFVAAACLLACTATRNRDGSMSFAFAPDMVITAFGLESAISQLNDLLADCLSGAFPRTCTDEERADIHKTVESLLEHKDRMGQHPIPGGTVGAS
jgi:hypothetical protein